jgi:transcriptional regulator with XRE-family HTH domain
MPSSTPSPEAGRQLKDARVRVKLSTRDVERLSQKIAQEKRNQEYYISHAWLIEIEKGAFRPSIYKLYSLSIIYKLRYDDILAFFEIDVGNIGREQIWLTLPRSHLIENLTQGVPPPVEIQSELRGGIQLEKTNLVSQMFNQWGRLPVALLPSSDQDQSHYGYVGTEDFTLFPLIRPGSFVQIDPNQKRIDRDSWSNEFDRPIYFVELHDSYACSWCELKDRQLLLVPYPQSGTRVRQVRFPEDAEIVGRVTAVSMRIAGPSSTSR